MIKQARVSLSSRREADVLVDDYLPLITAPMYSVVSSDSEGISNAIEFQDKGVRICMPRGKQCTASRKYGDSYFESYSIQEVKELFINSDHGMFRGPDKIYANTSICIDTAVGSLPQLHSLIRQLKERYGNQLLIMAGNVASLEAFQELAKTGVDYIRVGIGGGAGCNTTANTGVGQEDLYELLIYCREWLDKYNSRIYDKSVLLNPFLEDESEREFQEFRKRELDKLLKVKIVADGISSYVKLCEELYGFNDNGYAAIIKLLEVSDLVMIGKLFAQCEESAGEKKEVEPHFVKDMIGNLHIELGEGKKVLYQGMSTVEAQKDYREDVKPSEGSSTWLDVRWTLQEWLYGSEKQDQYPYLNGFVNSLKSAMSYKGVNNLQDFKFR